MPLFEFELDRVEDITPWGEPGRQSLSWFALTCGVFRMRMGQHTLFRYSPEVLQHWGGERQDADYQIAAFARDMLGSVAAAAAPLPSLFERLAADWPLLSRLRAESGSDSAAGVAEHESYNAWRWLGERSPCTSYLTASPDLSFVRVQGDVHVHWDNRRGVVDGIPVWADQYGMAVMPVHSFVEECRGFADRLLGQMQLRVDDIASGMAKPQVPVDVAALRRQHETWRVEFDSYFKQYEPDIPWDQADVAIRSIATRIGALPR